ncbi:hypothetical protein AB0K00_04045 [Dactylosporangium sp. NPDC049525]|uniref:hypothetical protein n=1 Tax=Dactylosporangium sp. NPDC049525 TaxID=3154730 RepID=UPI00341F816E
MWPTSPRVLPYYRESGRLPRSSNTPGGLRRVVRVRVHVPFLALALLTVAGCAQSQTTPAVATAASRPPVPAVSVSSSPAESAYDKALRYTRCMTTHGAPTADPVAGEALVTTNVMHVGDTAAVIDARRQAFAACQVYLPSTWPVKQSSADAAREKPFRDCVRQQGVDWPEPDASGYVNLPTDPNAMTTPAYEGAIQACRHLLDDPANQLPENR